MSELMSGFAFVNDGRTFTCAIEVARRAQPEAWWWFRVSTDDHQRYAPFRADETDTPDTVRERVLAYYEHMLVRRAEPWRGRWPQGRREQPATAAPTTAPATPVS